MKVLTIFGTRPEAIKMAPVVRELEKCPDRIESVVCVTAQHRQMLDQVLNIFHIRPDIDLDLMENDQSPASLTSRVRFSPLPSFSRESTTLRLCSLCRKPSSYSSSRTSSPTCPKGVCPRS